MSDKLQEAKSGTPAAEAKKVEIYCQMYAPASRRCVVKSIYQRCRTFTSPMIKKLDPAAFAKLAVCEHLSLSTNTVEGLRFSRTARLRPPSPISLLT